MRPRCARGRRHDRTREANGCATERANAADRGGWLPAPVACAAEAVLLGGLSLRLVWPPADEPWVGRFLSPMVGGRGGVRVQLSRASEGSGAEWSTASEFSYPKRPGNCY